MSDFPSTARVVIIGGGLAGGISAIHLAKSGKRVALLEKEKKPHHKVCGEYLSEEGVAYLDEVGFPFDQIASPSIYNFEFHSQKSSVGNRLPMVARGVSRKLTDQWLLEKAHDLGVDVLCGHRVLGFEKNDSIFEVRTSNQKFYSDVLFVASGKHDISTEPKRKGVENDLVGFKVHLKLGEVQSSQLQNSIELFSFSGGYGGLSPIEGGLFNFCYLLDGKTIKSQGLASQWPAHKEYLSGQHPILEKRFNNSESQFEKLVAISKVPYGFQRSLNLDVEMDGLFYLGDQAAVIPSFTGEGMTIALTSARMAVDFAINYDDKSIASKEYTKKLNEMIGSRMKFAVPIHRIMISSYSNLAAYGVKLLPGAVPLLFKKTRCPQPFFWRNFYC